LIDVGGGTTDIAVYHDGDGEAYRSDPMGGNHVTNDIAAGLRTPFQRRRALENSAMVSPGLRWRRKDERVEVSCVAGKGAGTISRQILCEIIEPRLDEIFEMVQKEIA
jgi:cell division protein FtsA